MWVLLGPSYEAADCIIVIRLSWDRPLAIIRPLPGFEVLDELTILGWINGLLLLLLFVVIVFKPPLRLLLFKKPVGIIGLAAFSILPRLPPNCGTCITSPVLMYLQKKFFFSDLTLSFNKAFSLRRIFFFENKQNLKFLTQINDNLVRKNWVDYDTIIIYISEKNLV